MGPAGEHKEHEDREAGRSGFAREIASAYAAKAGLHRHEDGRIDVLRSAGGIRGVVESVLPGLVFLVAFTALKDLVLSAVLSVAVAAVFVVARLAGRSTPTQAFAGIVGIGVSAALALFTGKAENFYVSGFVTNAAYILVLAISIAVRWPLIGVLFGFLRNEGLHWRGDAVRARQYRIGTWIMVAVLALRLVVEVPLYLMGDAGLVALGAMRLILGVPLYALGLWLAWLVTRVIASAPEDAARAAEGDARP
ncbi:DUF3159 domain-containing protein [Sinomonas sp. ASV322]|uniref:DUF3159 domain-containing protein n=1 Tax=Sinomonas sp. ASV322 TaxID=3041920 RepID=UPI0027DC340C|nr:DUF3159 domain-containing protein [Sinomonas sp. ASV322]MDQ4500871.1 DUF3159 domain-containing protein [Sinomonas sp. ASV322]